MNVVIRPLAETDRRAARSLIEGELAGTPYLETPLWALDTALDGRTTEALGLVATRDDDVVGLVLYGAYAGARGAGRGYFVVVSAAARLQRIGLRLMEATHADLAGRGARFVLSELPEDAVSRPARELLERCGYEEEARVPDYFRPGVAILFLRYDVLQQGGPQRG